MPSVMRIAYRDRRFYWARRYVKNDHEIDLPVPLGMNDDGAIAAVRFYLQGRADSDREWRELLDAAAAQGWRSAELVLAAARRPTNVQPR